LHGNIPEEHARVIGAVQHIDLTNGVQWELRFKYYSLSVEAINFWLTKFLFPKDVRDAVSVENHCICLAPAFWAINWLLRYKWKSCLVAPSSETEWARFRQLESHQWINARPFV
jgi:hypothetical protein